MDRIEIDGKMYAAKDCSGMACYDCALLLLTDIDCDDYPCCDFEREDGREIVWIEEKSWLTKTHKESNMKIITKKECCETTSELVEGIKRGTVFSGDCGDFAFAGVFIKNHGCKFTRLALTGKREGGWEVGNIYDYGNCAIDNYKELNAYLCIEE